MLDPPCQLKETDQSTTDLIEQLPVTAAEESFQIAEFFITERKKTDAFIINKSTTLGDDDAVHLPLDEIIRGVQDDSVSMLIQFVITPREIHADINDRQQDILHERDYGPVNTVLNAIFDDHTTSETDSRDPDDLTGDADSRYHDLEQVEGRKAFELNLRAIAVGTPEAAEKGFDHVRTVIDETLTEFVSVDYNSYAAPASQEISRIPPWNRKKRVWEQFLGQAPRRWEDISLRRRRTPAFFADADTIWNYLLVSTESGDGEVWNLGASPRDTHPTDKPASDEYAGYQWDGSFADMCDESQSSNNPNA
jgi:hypothetical protein